MRKAILILVLLVSVISVEAKRVVKRDSITIFGRVLCEGKPLAGVPVSDGVHIVKTDSLGKYAIASHKFQNTVFVITPSGYEPECKKRILPRFWALLAIVNALFKNSLPPSSPIESKSIPIIIYT